MEDYINAKKVFLVLFATITLFAIFPPSKTPLPPNFSKEKRRFIGIGIIFAKNDLVLLIYRHGSFLNRDTFGLVGGLAQKHESLGDAAIRIADTEIGIEIEKKDLNLIHCISSQEDGIEVIGFYFVVTKWKGEPYNAASDTHQYISWCPVDRLPENLIERNRIAIESMKNGILYSEYGY